MTDNAFNMRQVEAYIASLVNPRPQLELRLLRARYDQEQMDALIGELTALRRQFFGEVAP